MEFIDGNIDDEQVCVIIRRLVQGQNRQLRYAITSHGNVYYARCKLRTAKDPVHFDVEELITFNYSLPKNFPFQLPGDLTHKMYTSIPSVESIVQANITAISAIYDCYVRLEPDCAPPAIADFCMPSPITRAKNAAADAQHAAVNARDAVIGARESVITVRESTMTTREAAVESREATVASREAVVALREVALHN